VFTSRKLIIIATLIGSIQTAIADEAADAVQVLSQFWKGASEHGSVSQFVGDAKTHKMRDAGQMDDGTAYVETSEAPFRFLKVSDAPDGLYSSCFFDHSCVVVDCLFKRECIINTEVESDPVYQDPQREGTHYFKRAEDGGYVTPANADVVKQDLRTLIRLNAAPPDPMPVPGR
jgi:hypothetical protein